jgi:hypothetical protein
MSPASSLVHTFNGRPTAHAHLYGFVIVRLKYSTKSNQRFGQSAFEANVSPDHPPRQHAGPDLHLVHHDVCFGTYTKRIRWLAPVRNALHVATDFNTPLLPFFTNDSAA